MSEYPNPISSILNGDIEKISSEAEVRLASLEKKILIGDDVVNAQENLREEADRIVEDLSRQIFEIFNSYQHN